MTCIDVSPVAATVRFGSPILWDEEHLWNLVLEAVCELGPAAALEILCEPAPAVPTQGGQKSRGAEPVPAGSSLRRKPRA